VGADVLAEGVPSAAIRLLADVRAFGGYAVDDRPAALDRLEETLGRDLTDRLVTSLTEEPADVYRGPG
jgi:hypothetical protein